MFFFHPSKRWSSACSSAPFWVCCVWRQCSASEGPEVKGGHRKGRQGARPCQPAGGLPSTPTPANLPPRDRGEGGDPRPARPVPFSPRRPSRPGRQRMRPSCPPGGDAASLCAESRGTGGSRGTPRFPQFTPKIYFSKYVYSNRSVSVRDQGWPRSHFPTPGTE